MKSEPHTVSHQNGFILVLTIWMLAAFAIIAAGVASNTNILVASALEAKENNHAEWDRLSAQSTVIYWLLTGRYTFKGLEISTAPAPLDDMGALDLLPTGSEIRLDNTIYRFNNLLVSLQDLGGLIGLNTLTPTTFERLLEDTGIEAWHTAVLYAQIRDYTDSDDFLNINGAEAWDYKKEGKPAPANRSFVLPMELHRVLSWPETISVRSLLSDVTVRPLYWNINTATPRAIGVMTGASQAAVAVIMEYRKEGFFTSYRQVSQLTNELIVGDPMETTFVPSSHLRLYTWRESELRRGVDITLTPLATDKPWRIEKVYFYPGIEDNDKQDFIDLSTYVVP